MLTVGIPMGAKIVTAHFHPGGIAAVYDPGCGAWELRALPPESKNHEVRDMAARSSSRALIPLSLVEGERPGTGAELARGFADWTSR